MDSQERITLMFKHSGMSKKEWAKKTGIAESSLILICQGKGNATPGILNKAANASPLFNRTWVLTGFGAMLTDGTPEPSVANSVAQNDEVQDARTVQFTAHLMKQNELLMAEKAKMLDIIMNLTAQVGKLNLQPNAGYAKEVRLFEDLASVA